MVNPYTARERASCGIFGARTTAQDRAPEPYAHLFSSDIQKMNRREGEATKRPTLPRPPQRLGPHISEKTWRSGDIEFARPAHRQHGDAVCEDKVDGRLRGEVAEPEGLKGLSRLPRSQRRRRPESSPHRLADAEATRIAAAECESDAFLFETVAAKISNRSNGHQPESNETPTTVESGEFWFPLP